MKRIGIKIFTIAMALTVGSTVLVGGIGSAATTHTHTFSSDSWGKDNVNHWRGATCSHTTLVKDVTQHNFVNGACVCGMQESSVTTAHKHTYNTAAWESDGTNHWRESACGHEVVKDIAPHTYSNGVCSTCSYQQPAPAQHKHSYDMDEWTTTSTHHWRSATCDHDIIKNYSAHSMQGDTCTVCLYSPNNAIKTYGGYSESLYVEWTTSSAESATVQYKLAGGSWTNVDSQLIRQKSSTLARVDAVGLKAGTYSIKIVDGAKTYTKDNIVVKAYDRSGYAHFKATEGVGAYNNDGTPKTDAKIIYVDEATKNTVTCKFGSTTYTGIVNILSKASKSTTPLIVRILGQISAATWKSLTYGKSSLSASDVKGINEKQLPINSDELTQAALIAGGYNQLDTSKYSELEGLESKAIYSSGEYDSFWNNCVINNAKNVTVEGVGTDAQIFQWGLTWKSGNSIEVRNITFDDSTEDACSFEGSGDATDVDAFTSKRIWVHNNTFNEGINYWDICKEQDKKEGDGATDLKRASYITISYNRYYKNHKTGLVGANDACTTANVTFHHNFYDTCVSRLPLGRQANMHMYNNYYYNSTGTNMSLRSGAYALIEYCYFDNAKTPIETKDGEAKYGGKKAVVKLFNCKVDATTNSSYTLNTTNYNIIVVTSRETLVANVNIFNQNFDTDPDFFYYDATNKKSDVTDLITDIDQVKVLIPQLAGVNKIG